MKIQPDADGFRLTYDDGRTQVLWTEIVADLDTPVSAMLKLAADRPNSFLLESVEGGATRGRYSIIGYDPDLIWRCFPGGKAEINRNVLTDPDAFVPCPAAEKEGGLASLRCVCFHVGRRRSRQPLRLSVPEFARGARASRF